MPHSLYDGIMRASDVWGCGSVVEARMCGNEEALGKFSAQMMIAILVAFVTWVLMDALRQKRQLEATALGKTVERGTQTEFNLVVLLSGR